MLLGGDCDHRYVYDSESLENVCGLCGLVEGTGTGGLDQKLLKDEEFESIEIVDNSFSTATATAAAAAEGQEQQQEQEQQQQHMEIGTEGFLVARPTHIDFSNGGFLSTKIDNRNVDSQGKSTDRSYTNKLKYNHNYILSSMGVQPTFKNSIWRISSYADKLGLPVHVQERAAEVFKRIYGEKANIHNSNNMVCACLYFACKEHRINKKLDDIAEIARAGRAPNEEEEKSIKPIKKSIFLCYQSLVFNKDTGDTRLKIPKYFSRTQDISYVGNKIGLPESTIRYAMVMHNDIHEKNRLFFAGKSSKLTATILLYISALIHNDFLRDDIDIEVEKFCDCVGNRISKYILHKRAGDFLNHELFTEYKRRKEERNIII